MKSVANDVEGNARELFYAMLAGETYQLLALLSVAVDDYHRYSGIYHGTPRWFGWMKNTPQIPFGDVDVIYSVEKVMMMTSSRLNHQCLC